jgi:hypothetical protein
MGLRQSNAGNVLSLVQQQQDYLDKYQIVSVAGLSKTIMGIDSDNRDTSNCVLIDVIASLLPIANPLDVSVRPSSGSQQIVSFGDVIGIRTQHRRSDIITDMIVGRAC